LIIKTKNKTKQKNFRKTMLLVQHCSKIKLKMALISWVWWCMPAVPTTQEAEAG
jgi:hypothetical protein